MTKIPSVAILAVLAFGCSSTNYVLEPSSVNPYTEAQLMKKISGEEVTVEFTNGKTAEARIFLVERDSCRWTELRSGLMQSARTKDIRKVVTKGHSRGALVGMGIGMFASGLIYRLSVGKGGGAEYDWLGPVLVLTGGGVLGAVAGAIVGHSYEYEFVWFKRSPEAETRNKMNPPQEKKQQ